MHNKPGNPGSPAAENPVLKAPAGGPCGGTGALHAGAADSLQCEFRPAIADDEERLPDIGWHSVGAPDNPTGHPVHHGSVHPHFGHLCCTVRCEERLRLPQQNRGTEVGATGQDHR